MSAVNRWALLLCVCCLGLAVSPPLAWSADAAIVAAAGSVDASDPGKLIESASRAMFGEIEGRRPEYRKNPQLLRELIDSVLLVHFDTEHAARTVLGQHWRGATADQRQRFIAGFYQSMLSNYGNAILEFSAERLKVLPYKGESEQKSASVRTQVRRSDGSLVAVNYSLRLGEQGWKAWDVVIEGISYVKSFRDDFGAEINQKGLDSVIARLETQSRSAANAGRASK